MSVDATTSGVLSLDEAADYLRLPRETVRREADRGAIPGRRIGQEWRFLKSALDDWLGARDGRLALLRFAGAFADDATLPELRRKIYAERGRPEVEGPSPP